MTETVYCVARDRAHAEQIVDELKAAGCPRDAISVLFTDKSGTRDFAETEETKAPESATTGGVAGAGIGAVLGWLAGIGTLAIPGVGPFIAAGPIMGALSGAGVGAATGGIIGALVGLGIPEHEAKEYDTMIRDGGALISVSADNSAKFDAREIFERLGARNVRSSDDFNVPPGTTTGTGSTVRP
jgi:hypothetical protein